MTGPARAQNPTTGIAFILLGVLAISVNDMLIKFLSGGYPLHQMVFTRSAIGIVFSLIMVQFEGGWQVLKTGQPGLHALRGLMIVVANMSFFAALAVLPLAEATAVFFVGPLMITLLSIPLLGVVVMTRPWDTGGAREVPVYVYLLPVFAALTYALNQVLTRKLGVASK